MSVGIGFEVFSEDYTISESYTQRIEQSTEDTYIYEKTNTKKVTCNAPIAGTNAKIWQWVTETADGKSRAYTLEFVCRSGDIWDTKPSCPPGACADNPCTVCSDDWAV